MTGPYRGAYGLRLGPPLEDTYLVDVPQGWPDWQLAWRQTPLHERQPERIGPDDAVLNLRPRGQVLIDRRTRTSTFLLPAAPRPVAWAHPHLASTAVVAAWWTGRRPFHAGAFVANGGAWGILGGRRDGKSTMLAWLTAHGHEIVCDDVLVVDQGDALAGPRCIDLRQSASTHFGMGTDIGRVGTRQRWRAPLAPIAAAVPLRGWVLPEWGAKTGVLRMSARARLPALLAGQSLIAPETGGGKDWLDLLACPMLSFTRPRQWSAIDSAMARLLEEVAGR
jgi:hypothetical protein